MMTFKTVLFGVSGIQLALFPMCGYAQTSNFDSAFGQQSVEARLSLNIPLGESGDRSKTKPRLNFGVRSYSQKPSLSTDWMRVGQQNYRDISFGVTIEGTPQLMMNEQVLNLPEDDQANIGTAGKIGLGVAAVALAGVAVLTVVFATADFSEE